MQAPQNEGHLDLKMPRPSRDLRVAVEKACARMPHDHWRWRYKGRMVPRLVLIPNAERDCLNTNPACFGDRGAGVGLNPRVRTALLLPDDRNSERVLTPQDLCQFRRLAAAIWHDLGGMPAEPESDGGPSLERVLRVRNEKTVRERLDDGRALWAKLAAWPWALWPSGRPPTHWHRRGPDLEEMAVFYSWREGEFIRPVELRARA